MDHTRIFSLGVVVFRVCLMVAVIWTFFPDTLAPRYGNSVFIIVPYIILVLLARFVDIHVER